MGRGCPRKHENMRNEALSTLTFCLPTLRNGVDCIQVLCLRSFDSARVSQRGLPVGVSIKVESVGGFPTSRGEEERAGGKTELQTGGY